MQQLTAKPLTVKEVQQLKAARDLLVKIQRQATGRHGYSHVMFAAAARAATGIEDAIRADTAIKSDRINAMIEGRAIETEKKFAGLLPRGRAD